MAEILNYNYMNFRRYLKRRDEVGHAKAIAEFKREQAEGILDCMVSAGSHQASVTSADCLAISRYVDSTPDIPDRQSLEELLESMDVSKFTLLEED
jgi:hypothetical protein